jgi:hypothetical protein
VNCYTEEMKGNGYVNKMVIRNGLKRIKPNPLSKKKIDQINNEYETRIKLCLRCGGKPFTKIFNIRLNGGKQCVLHTITCIGGTCEICHKPAYPNQPLHPHEKVPRSKGGKLSLNNSVMVHDYPCHAEAQNNLVKWSRDGEQQQP